MKERSEDYCLPGNQENVENKKYNQNIQWSIWVLEGAEKIEEKRCTFQVFILEGKHKRKKAGKEEKKPHNTMKWCKDLWLFYTVSVEIT